MAAVSQASSTQLDTDGERKYSSAELRAQKKERRKSLRERLVGGLRASSTTSLFSSPAHEDEDQNTNHVKFDGTHSAEPRLRYKDGGKNSTSSSPPRLFAFAFVLLGGSQKLQFGSREVRRAFECGQWEGMATALPRVWLWGRLS